jgi:hypothetical protein
MPRWYSTAPTGKSVRKNRAPDLVPVAPERMRSLVRLVANLPPELLTPFVAEMEKARSATLAAADEETGRA